MMIDRLEFRRGNDAALAFHTVRGNAVEGNPYSEFNCCGYSGDTPTHVAECRRLLCSEIGIPEDRLITARQVHGTEVVAIDRDFIANPHVLDGIDGLVTDVPGIAIGVFTADCVPIIMLDPVKEVAAAVHAGWKGTLNGIATKAVEKMKELGAAAADIMVAFGPSICQNCFEVGNEVAVQFAEKGLATPDIISRDAQTGKAHIDLVKANIHWLTNAGIPLENINTHNECTKCTPSRLFSARRLGINSGRILTAITLLCR